MAILEVQAMVRPQEGLDLKNSIKSRSQNLSEKKSNFSRQLKKMSNRETESLSSVSKDLPLKKTALARPTFEQKSDSIVDANGAAEKHAPVQEKPDQKITEENIYPAGVEAGSSQEQDKQSRDEDNDIPVSISLLQPEWALSGIPVSEESTTTGMVDIETAPGAGAQMVDQGPEPIVTMSETAQTQVTEQTLKQITIQPVVEMLENMQSQAADKKVQVSVEVTRPTSEPTQAWSQLEANGTVQAGNTQENVPEVQGKENTYDARTTLFTQAAQGESTAGSSSNKETMVNNPQVDTLSIPGNQAMDTEKITAPTTQSASGNPSSINDNPRIAKEPEQLAEKNSATSTLLSMTTNVLDAEKAKQAGKASDKDRIKLQFLEKPLGDQVNQKNEEAVKNVKKIMELENHRLANSKIPAEALPVEEAASETGVEEGKTLTLLDKTLIELAKPGGEVGKAIPTNSARPAVSPEELMEQIVKKVELVSKQANSEMRIQLKPEFLGKMVIQIIVEDGVITARFTTESQQVKQVLEANMNTLKQNLEANGLRVEKTEVNVQLDNGGNFNNNSEGNRQQLWQQMTSQGRTPTHYNSFNNAYDAEIEDLNLHQRETDTRDFIDEGRVDFII
jgi:flagellar hook-length control protein FliK